jgi:hypothetical protein
LNGVIEKVRDTDGNEYRENSVLDGFWNDCRFGSVPLRLHEIQRWTLPPS